MPDALSAPLRGAKRGLVALFVAALLATSLASADPVAGSGLSSQISSNRRSQRYSESVMRQADQAVSQINRQRKVTRKAFKRAKRSVKQSRRRLGQAQQIVRIRTGRLEVARARFAELDEGADLKAWNKRLRGLRRDLRAAQANRRHQARSLRQSLRNRSARKRSLASLKRAKRAAIGRRESAEGALGARIVQMTRLAQLRAANKTNVALSAGSTFAWPSAGRITQPFGCTGVRFNPRRGSCRHFHDGIDVVSGYGSAVRAAAVGVVAYVGWNPWDARGRAFIVVIGHPNGYVTRYGHLTPTRRVRVGQLVNKGQVIGRMGNTGFSTGTHLHMELLRGTTPLNPTAYFPSGVMKVKASKSKASSKSKRKQGKAKRKAQGRKAAAKQRRGKATSRQAAAIARAEAGATVTLPGAVAPALVFSCETMTLERQPVRIGPAPGHGEAVTAAAADDVEAGADCLPSSPTEGDDAGATQGKGARAGGPADLVAPLTAPQASDRDASVPRRGASPIPQ